jgi:hypothetical protein
VNFLGIPYRVSLNIKQVETYGLIRWRELRNAGRIAESELRCIIFNICNLGLLLSINIAARIAKYLAASLAMLNVVIAPRRLPLPTAFYVI